MSEKTNTTIDALPVSSVSLTEEHSKWDKGRIICAFWLLGMCNNYIYVIMLSAAHDVISKVEFGNNSTVSFDNTTTTARPPSYERECNTLSTGAILLADILPTLFVKIACPFLPFFLHFRMAFAVITGIVALVLVGVAKSITLALIGVSFASFNSGLGEVTLLAYSTQFPLIAVPAWSSGTGGAGLAGSFVYAGLTGVGLTPEMTLFVSIFDPILFAIVFWVVLKHPTKKTSSRNPDSVQLEGQLAAGSDLVVPKNLQSKPQDSVMDKLLDDVKYIPKLLPFMIPVGLVYYFEYLINSGLFELLQFENTSIDKESQFRWYNAMYQIGVFVSRSSVTWLQIEKVWIMSLLQGLNLIVLSLDAIYGFIPNVWIMFALIFWEGLLGGSAYVNTFYTMSYKVPEQKRLFALSIASVADTFGIVSAGLSSFPVHDAICNWPYDPVFRWPHL